MEVKTVTVTGADDSVDIGELIDVAEEFPFIEWGILVSHSDIGMPRFPSEMWFDALCRAAVLHDLPLSMHICGKWVRHICKGNWTIFDWRSRDVLSQSFKRIQLNHGNAKIKDGFHAGLAENAWDGLQFIFQAYGGDCRMIQGAVAAGIDAVPLFDSSGGRGVLPSEWPASVGDYCGYAGGLSADNLSSNMDMIADVATCPVWVDAETKLRNDDNSIFLMDEVRKFASIASSWVK